MLGLPPQPKTAGKNLGVWVDSALSFDVQAKSVAGTCFGLLHGLKSILGLFDSHTRQMIIQSTILSRRDYCNALPLGSNKTVIKRLQRAQNTAAWLLFALPKHCSVSGLIYRLHWLPVEQRIHFKALCISHKILMGYDPPILGELCLPYVPARTLCSADLHLTRVPRVCKARAGRRSFMAIAPALWNSLPLSIRHIQDHWTFRRAIKTWLFFDY